MQLNCWQHFEVLAIRGHIWLPFHQACHYTLCIVRTKMPLKTKKKALQALKEIGEEFGGRSSIHGLSYVADPLLPSCERLLWLFLFLCGLGLAVYLNVSTYNAWRANMVVTNMRSNGKLVNELDFPTVTICGSGLHMAGVEEALKEDFKKWIEKRGKAGTDNIGRDLEEYMEETYQITNREWNILDILNTMIAPNNAESSLGANGARENFAACAGKQKNDHKDLKESKDKRQVKNEAGFKGPVDISKGTLIGSLPFLEKEFSIELSFFIQEPEGEDSVSIYEILSLRGENEEGELVEGSLYFEQSDGNLIVDFPDINSAESSSSQILTKKPKFGKWNLLTIQQLNDSTSTRFFKFRASLNGEIEIQNKNRNTQVIKNIEIQACFNESQPMTGQVKDFKLQNGVNADDISEDPSESEISVEYDKEVDVANENKSIGNLSSFGQEFNLSFEFFPEPLITPAEATTRLCFLSIHTRKSIGNGMEEAEMHFSVYGSSLLGRFNTEYTVDDFDGNPSNYRRFNFRGQGVINFSVWNKFEI